MSSPHHTECEHKSPFYGGFLLILNITPEKLKLIFEKMHVLQQVEISLFTIAHTQNEALCLYHQRNCPSPTHVNPAMQKDVLQRQVQNRVAPTTFTSFQKHPSMLRPLICL